MKYFFGQYSVPHFMRYFLFIACRLHQPTRTTPNRHLLVPAQSASVAPPTTQQVLFRGIFAHNLNRNQLITTLERNAYAMEIKKLQCLKQVLRPKYQAQPSGEEDKIYSQSLEIKKQSSKTNLLRTCLEGEKTITCLNIVVDVSHVTMLTRCI